MPLELPNGAHLDAHEFVSPIGTTGMGEIDLARDTRLDRSRIRG